MLQSFLSKLFKKYSGWRYARTAAMGISGKKGIFFAIGEGLRILSSVFYTLVNKYLCIRRLAGARHVSPAGLWILWPDGGSEPLTSAPRSEFMTQSLVLLIDVCRGLGIPPPRIKNIGSVFLRPILAQDLPWAGIIFFVFFGQLWNFFSKICAHSELYRNLMAGIFEISFFFGNIAFPLSPVF